MKPMLLDCLRMVREFHLAFDHPVHDTPNFGDEKLNELRINLLLEEVTELNDALDAENRVDTLDALCDIQYVLSGAALAWGIPGYVDCNWNFVSSLGFHVETLVDSKSLTLDAANLQKALLSEVREHRFEFVFWKAFEECHSSNLSKMWTEEECDKMETQEMRDCITSVARMRDDGRRFIVKRPDGKIIKSPSYSPANFSQFV